VDENIYDMFASVNGTKLENWISCAYWCIKLCSRGYFRSNLDNTIDRPIYYASRLMNNAKKKLYNNWKGSFSNDICCEEIQTLFVRK
jgi:hypothetical protein